MDAIKKKMQAMKLEKDNAADKADAMEGQAKDANLRAEKVNEEVRELQKKLQQVELDLEMNKQQLEQANKDLEEKEKTLTNAESEVAALNRKVQLIEEDLERSEERLGTATVKLAEASQAADESARMCKVLENRAQQDEERMDQLTNQLKEARLLAEDADNKSDEVSRKLAFVEDELEVAEDRVKGGDAKIMELEEELKVVGNSLKSLEVSEEKANQRVERNACIERKEQAAKIHTLEQKIRTLHSTKERLRNERDGLKLIDNQEVASAEALEEELAEIQSAKVRKTAELDELKNESKEIERRIKETQEELSKHVRARESLEERIEPLEGQIMDQTTQLKEMRANQQFGKERMEQAKNKLNLAKSDLLKKQEFLHEKIQAGRGVGERLEVLRHVPIILAEMKRLKNTIAKINDSIENPIELQQKHDEKLQHCVRTAELIANLSLDSKELTTAVDKRKRAYMLTEEFYVSFAKNSFESVLNYRQFQGTMDIDLIAKKLELIVIPQQGSQGHTTTANLSGGERSFSTVAFLYALWNCINFPLHFLDEFDVYMDKLNRTKVMEVLLHYARDHPDLQFVFLTPQDVSFLVDKEGVVIHKLEDPERRQK